MQAWGGLSLGNVNTGGNFTQLYPSWVDAGSVAPGIALRRGPTEGAIGRMEVVPAAGVGGVFELWDAAGLLVGTNNANAGVLLTDAFIASEAAAKRARCIWRIDFAGALDGSNKLLGVRLAFTKGLVARYVQAATPGTNAVTINLVVDGGFRVWQGGIPE